MTLIQGNLVPKFQETFSHWDQRYNPYVDINFKGLYDFLYLPMDFKF